LEIQLFDCKYVLIVDLDKHILRIDDTSFFATKEEALHKDLNRMPFRKLYLEDGAPFC